jgi:hypothetical protein
MREIRLSGSEGGAGHTTPRPYPYQASRVPRFVVPPFRRCLTRAWVHAHATRVIRNRVNAE